MKTTTIPLLLAGILLLMVQCRDKKDNSSICPTKWFSFRGQGTQLETGQGATVSNGALELEVVNNSPYDQAFVRPIQPLTGDFEITIPYENYQGGGIFAGISPSEPMGGSLSAGVTLGEETSLIWNSSENPATVEAFGAGTGGTITFRRQGDQVTVTATVDGQTLTASGAGPVGNLSLSVGLSGSSTNSPSQVRFPTVIVSGGTNSSLSDEFDCDSVQ